jgi:outer membrane protein TolC
MFCQNALFRSERCIWAALIALSIITLGGPPASAQDAPVLRQLIDEGLRSNLALQQRDIDVQRSRAVLREVRSGFFPSLTVQARYSRAEGGRTIELPIGDLVNPAYQTLNDLLEARGKTATFPTVENQTIRFLREREQETTLQLRQPLFAPRVWYGTQAQRHQVTSEVASVEAFRRELVRDIKIAYYRVRQAERARDILNAAERLITENKRTNERLYAANTVTQDAVLRAEVEVLDIQQQRAAARARFDRARRALNGLVNRPLDAPLDTARVPVEMLVEWETAQMMQPRQAAWQLASGPTGAMRPSSTDGVQRPELRALSAAAEAADDQRRLAQSGYLPEVSLAVDGGVQGTSYGFSGEQPFVMASVVLRWNLFNGFADAARTEQAALTAQRLRTRREETTLRIQQQVQSAWDEVQVARRSLQTAEARVHAAREGFRITNRRAEEGRANQVTFLDARTTLTDAELNRSITRFELLARLAELEYATARYPLAAASR